MTYIEMLAIDAGLDPAGWTAADHRKAVAEVLAEWTPDGCPLLERELDAFYADPMTMAYGAYDCSPVVVQNHVARHGCNGIAANGYEPLLSWAV